MPDYKPTIFHMIIIIWVTSLLISFAFTEKAKTLPYSEFLSELRKGAIESVEVKDKEILGIFRGNDRKHKRFVTYRIEDPNLLKELSDKGTKFDARHESLLESIGRWLLWGAFGLLVFSLLNPRWRDEPASIHSFSSIEKNRARLYVEHNIETTFADVAGVDEAKEELSEVISYLKNPFQYSRLGGRLPKGILLVGPPGTGKTLLARAVAGEAGVPFFSISGSEFVELFVGVGAARVRDLFSQARQKAPCIIFIDELDALGRSRAAAGFVGSHDEKEQTLNQLLVELDGFDTSGGVVLLAATNRPEILDDALLRAGRFDRQISVDRPDKRGRIQILTVHIRKLVVSADIDVEHMAAATPGCTGADLANLVNEAALLATRRNASSVETCDFENAIERMVAGLERHNRLLTHKERETVAFHEMGHALVAINLSGVDQVQKVSIIPHGVSALGYTVQRPLEDRFLLTRSELEDKLAALMGGRAAELLVFGQPSTGAADDLKKATELASAMVIRYGMDDTVGLISAVEQSERFIAGPQMDVIGHSQNLMSEIDCSVHEILNVSFARATKILTENRQWLERAAGLLLHEETMSLEQILLCKQERKLPMVLDHSVS